MLKGLAAEGYVEADIKGGGSLPYGDVLRGYFEDLMVGADKEVEASGMEVEHPAE
jgi:hypothetical protein